MSKEYVLGIDTSNYTTSVAILYKEGDYLEARRLLDVPEGGLGLRQSQALFQHIQALPKLLKEILNSAKGTMVAVAASSKPRPLADSYMPVFKGGQSIGESIAISQHIPYYEFSHQEGHIEALRPDSLSLFNCFHLSGGTSELLKISNGDATIIGGSKDISFGQLLDRVGNSLGLDFPSGEEMDKMAFENEPSNLLTKIKVNDTHFNLSGIESQCKRLIKENEHLNNSALIAELFLKISYVLDEVCGNKKTLLVGGVSSSKTLKKLLAHKLNIIFPNNNLGKDNAVGIAKLGGSRVWP